MKLIRFSVVAALFATSIFANEDSTGINVSANMSLTSNYVWRGMTQTKDSPAIQGGVDLEYKGLYAGVWGSNVDFGANDNNSLELDIYGGYAGEIAGIGYDVGYIQYAYPNKSDEYNFGEAYVGVSKEWDKFGLSAKQSFGIETDDTNPEDFYEVGASTSVLPYEIGFDASYGNYDNIGYYYSLGLNRSFEKFDLSLAYIDFSHDTDSAADEDNVVATVSFAF
ncbi:TorF family putative porin [Sulfurimonas sp.]|jgi:uncharacterized protein (TIGR02001 family)|uniref:TorF family putative porin n=1 Tax=Sulfurimonas sp. TaxID=2022749 RepID=UPI002A35ABF6|nr:TorF family putative porin [Sulfurimonas sp.]MDY0122869.1 TorF family putative porin [Sulfurimonas sp.]